ncbi:MAG: nicotinate (nicotinamide) nucleotide adenylyltransferase [Enterobacterales bacterium]|nr:nicotinate (nicotinamide) nucleotide adenylyltransferase [Enterobacterales bacterium]
MSVHTSHMQWLFGGSFDPIHMGHLTIINRLRRLASDWPIRLLPCSTPALKKPNSASFEQRLEMLKLISSKIPQLVVDPREGKRSGPSYTIETLKSLRNDYPEHHFVLVIGDDNLSELKQWHKSEQLHQFCHCLVINRPGYSVDKLEQIMAEISFISVDSWQQFSEHRQGKYYRLQDIEENVSSSQIRAGAKASKSKKNAIQMNQYRQLPLEVENYIQTHSIYR